MKKHYVSIHKKDTHQVLPADGSTPEMTLGDYINQFIEKGETFLGIEGWNNDVSCDLIHACMVIPHHQWGEKITRTQTHEDGSILIWLSDSDRVTPDYTIHSTH